MAKKKKRKRKLTKKKKRKRSLKFPCITLKQAGTNLFLFISSAKKLWSIVDINRRIENKDEGYQRALSASRVKKIAKFIGNHNILPTSVLINFDKAEFDKKSSTLIIPNVPSAGWVIDGQHRLAGAHVSNTDIDLPVVAFTGLPFEEQVNSFVTINREQKGVPSSLYYELLHYLPPGKSEKELVQERTADIAKELKMDERSPFYNRIVTTTSPKKGQISLANFVRKVSPLIRRQGRLSTLSDESRLGILNNYYRSLSNIFPHEFRRHYPIFFKTMGFGALMEALPTFIDLTLQQYHGFRIADASKIFKTIENFNFDSWREMGTGGAAESSAANDIINELTRSLSSHGGAEIVLK
jgi:DGQHR domain-containing protein